MNNTSHGTSKIDKIPRFPSRGARRLDAMEEKINEIVEAVNKLSKQQMVNQV